MSLKGRSLLALAVALSAALVLGVVLQRSEDKSARLPANTRGTITAIDERAVGQASISVMTVSPAPAEDDAELQPFDGNHVNASGGYVFSYPPGWTVRETGTLTELLSADEQIAISFGLGPSGGIEPAYQDFVSLIDETYKGASVRLVRGDFVEDSLRVKVIGEATTQAGFPIWFTGRVIAPRGEQTLATLAAGPLESRDTEAKRANEILDSFAPIVGTGTS